MRKKSTLLLIFTLFLLFGFSACSSKNEGTNLDEEKLPDIVMYYADYTFGSSGRSPIKIEAEKITIYSNPSETHIEKACFNQYNSKGELILTGNADSAVSYNNEVITMKGNVKLSKETDGVKIECDELTWDDGNSKISSNGFVRVIYKDNTDISGYNFSGNVEENTYTFEKITEGKLSE